MAAGSVIVARVGRGMMLKAPVRFQILVAAASATEMQLPARRPMPVWVMMRVAHRRRAAARETRRGGVRAGLPVDWRCQKRVRRLGRERFDECCTLVAGGRSWAVYLVVVTGLSRSWERS